MNIYKGFKLTNTVLASALALALVGCGSSSDSSPTDTGTPTDPGNDIDPGDITDPIDFISAEYTLISAAGEDSDIDFSVEFAVGTWSTGSEINGESTYEGLPAWEVTSGSISAEAGNWGTVLAFQDGIEDDFSLFNSIQLKIATSGGYTQYKLAISGSGVGSEVIIPVDDSDRGWQEVSIDLSQFALNLSEIGYITVMGIGGTPSVSKIYVTDYKLIKESVILVDTQMEDDFVFKSSDSSVMSDLFVDGEDVIFGEWSTQTLTSDTTYEGLDAWNLSTANPSASQVWGSVLALESDTQFGTYNTDFSQYTNLKLKVASVGDFASYSVFIGSTIDGVTAGNAATFSLKDQAEWNEIDIDLDSYGADLSNVSQIVVYGNYANGIASQEIYVTDMIAYDTGVSTTYDKESSQDKFVFISASGDDVDIIVDGDNTVHNGNTTVGEWSTGTSMEVVEYNSLSSTQLTHAGSWGAVLAMAGDIFGEVLPLDLDLDKYSTINFKIAAQGGFSEYIAFLGTSTGAEAKYNLTVNADWTDVQINLNEVPLTLNQINQIVIYGIGGATGDRIYITDFNISK